MHEIKNCDYLLDSTKQTLNHSFQQIENGLL